MRLFNWLLLAEGAIIMSFAGYVAYKAMSEFVWALGGVGLYAFLVGVVGIVMVRARSPCLMSTYALMFLALILFHAAATIGFLFFEDKTVQLLQDLNSQGDNNAIRNYIDDHKSEFKYAALVVLGVESFTFLLSVCCAGNVSGLDDELLELDTVTVSQTSYLGPAPSQTPQTDARRAELNAKYGGLFEKRTDTYQ
jgi:hypothetical protein